MKRFFALAIVLVFVLNFAACGSSGDDASSAAFGAASSSEPAPHSQSESDPVSEEDTPATLKQENIPLSAAPTALNGKLAVHYIDVGQADVILVELPNAQTMLIDGGDKADGRTVANYLSDNGISAINYLVATHPHEDHIGGLPYVINSSIEIESVYMPRVESTTQIFEELLTGIERKGLSIHTARSDATILSIPDLQIDIVAPVGDSYANLNDWSAVVHLKYRDTDFLFMGDAETISTDQITADIDADVIKIAHHGSEIATSASFLEKVSPDFAVICVGKGNTYGHPDDTVLAMLHEHGVDVFRTDEQGTIIFTSDGENIEIDKQPVPYSPNASPSGVQAPVAGVAPTPPASAPDPLQDQSVTVFVTNTGAKYHLDGCRYLSKSKIPISLGDAKRSYGPCSVCDPPQ